MLEMPLYSDSHFNKSGTYTMGKQSCSKAVYKQLYYLYVVCE